MAETDTAPPPEAEDSIEEQMIRRARSSHQRLPLLEVVVDRFTLALGPMMKTHCAGAAAEATLDSLTYSSTGEAMEALPPHALAMVAQVDPDGGDIGVLVDRELLFAALEIMLGGRTAARTEASPRAFSAIERKFGQRLCQAALNSLSEAFNRVWDVGFAIDRIESSPQAMVLAAPSVPCVTVTMHVDFDGRGGRLIFLFPQPVFEEIRPMLAEPFRGGQIGGDSSWRDLLSDTLQDTSITVDAILCEPSIPMAKVLAWKPGQTIELGVTVDQDVTVSCAELRLFTAAIGRRRNGSLALKVMRDFSQEDEPTDVDFD